MSLPLRICVEKTSQDDIDHLKHLKSVSKSEQHYKKLSAAFYTAKLWPNYSKINVAFIGDPKDIHRTSIIELEAGRDENGNELAVDPLQKTIDQLDILSAIKKIVAERITPICNLEFNFVDDPKQAQVRISFDPAQGAWSLLGTDCLTKKDQTEATMNLGWFDVPTTCHEFGHTLGLIHEHQNPKGNVIQWDEKAVYAWAEQSQGWDHDTTYHNIIEKYDSTQINGSEFDPKSIMLYFFPASLTTNGKGTHQNLELSPYDVEYINSVYPNSPETPQKFYKDVYGKDIGSLKAFNRQNFKGVFDISSDPTTNGLIWVGIVIVILIGVGFIFLRNRSSSSDSRIKLSNRKVFG